MSNDALVGAGVSLGVIGLLAVLALASEPGTAEHGKLNGGLALLSVMILLISALHIYSSRPGSWGPDTAAVTPWMRRLRWAMVALPVVSLLFVVDYESFTFDAIGAGLRVLLGVLVICLLVAGRRLFGRAS